MTMKPETDNGDDHALPASTIDMSWGAIWNRLHKVDELNELCRYLSEFKPVEDGEELTDDSTVDNVES